MTWMTAFGIGRRGQGLRVPDFNSRLYSVNTGSKFDKMAEEFWFRFSRAEGSEDFFFSLWARFETSIKFICSHVQQIPDSGLSSVRLCQRVRTKHKCNNNASVGSRWAWQTQTVVRKEKNKHEATPGRARCKSSSASCSVQFLQFSLQNRQFIILTPFSLISHYCCFLMENNDSHVIDSLFW